MASSPSARAAGLRRLLAEARVGVAELEAVRDTLQAEVRRKEDTLWRLTRKSRVTVLDPPGEEPDLDNVPPSQRLVVPEDVLDFVELDPETTTELEWTGTSGQKITVIAGLERFPRLELISFRSGFIRKPAGLDHLAGSLRAIELYENRLRTLEGVQRMTLLETLDVSYNRLLAMEAPLLAPLGATLTKLYMAENRLTEIHPQALLPLVHLRVLDLGGNNLRTIQGLDALIHLEELWLGKNKITKIEGLDALVALKRLSLQSNRLTKMEGLGALAALEELYLSDQGVGAVEGLEGLARLNTLDLTNNRISSMAGLPAFPLMTDLWVAANQVATYDEIWRLKPLLPRIDTLVFERNPIASDAEYRSKIKENFPTLTYIDATPCV